MRVWMDGPQIWILKLCKHQTFFTYLKGLWSHTKEIKAFLMYLLELLNCQSWEDLENIVKAVQINECLKVMILLVLVQVFTFLSL